MKADTGHLVDMQGIGEKEAERMLRDGYEPVPDELQTQARLELAGRKECYVGKNASGSLSKHMRYKMKKKLQIAKTSRRKNRCYHG